VEPDRLATADILHLVKEQALENLRDTTLADVFFVMTVLAIALTSLVLINKGLLAKALQVKRLTIPSFFIVIYIVLMSLPAIVWFYAEPQDPIRYTYFIAIQSVLLTFPLGMVFANALFRDLSCPPRVVQRFFSAPLEKSSDDRHAFRLWLLMMVAAVTVATVYMLTSPYVPLIGAFTSYGELEASLVRRAVVAEGVAIHYGHALTARLLLPFCLIYSYFMAYLYGGHWRFLFWPTLGVATFVSALTFDRMFPLSVVLFLVLAVYFKYDDLTAKGTVTGRRRARRMSTVRLVGYVGALLLVAMLIGGILSLTQFNKPMNLEIIKVTATDFFINRFVLDPSYMAWIYFEEFNEPNKLMYGTSLHVLISRAFGVDFFPTISPSFVAELWVNFWWFGVLLGTALVGCVLQLIQVKVFDRKTVPALSLYIVMLMNGAWVIYGHLLATMVISVYVPSILILTHFKRRRKAAAHAAERIGPHIGNVAPQLR
jgi:hypothetical protein